jgi:hypothetical protein
LEAEMKLRKILKWLAVVLFVGHVPVLYAYYFQLAVSVGELKSAHAEHVAQLEESLSNCQAFNNRTLQENSASAKVEDEEVQRKRRNLFWAALNGATATKDAPPEARLGAALAEFRDGARKGDKAAVDTGLIKFYFAKGMIFLSREEMAAIEESVKKGGDVPALEIINMFMKADERAGHFITMVLRDKARMEAFFQGEKVPLE